MSLFFFFKYQAAGNDFILFDDRQRRFPTEDRSFISRLCHRHFGIGGDGVLLLQPSTTADFCLRIFNADGGEAEQCGNGIRCGVDFVHRQLLPRDHYKIQTMNRVVECSFQNALIRTDLGPYRWIKENLPLDDLSVQLIDTGVPHLVTFVSTSDFSPFEEVAPSLRWDRRILSFEKKGVNVSFSKISGNKVYVRTHERGVEKETLACGTAAAAVAIAARKQYSLPLPISVIPASGDPLFVEVSSKKVVVSGKATLVFKGTTCYSGKNDDPY